MEISVNSNVISLFLYTIERALKVSCDKRNQIRILERFLKDDNNGYLFIGNGAIINSSQTFENAGISNDSVLFAMKSHEKQSAIFHKLMKLSNDQDFEIHLKISFSRTLRYEYFRLRDIQLNKIDGNYKSCNYNYLIFQLDQSNDCIPEKKASLKTDYKPFLNPPVEPLPIFW